MPMRTKLALRPKWHLFNFTNPCIDGYVPVVLLALSSKIFRSMSPRLSGVSHLCNFLGGDCTFPFPSRLTQLFPRQGSCRTLLFVSLKPCYSTFIGLRLSPLRDDYIIGLLSEHTRGHSKAIHTLPYFPQKTQQSIHSARTPLSSTPVSRRGVLQTFT